MKINKIKKWWKKFSFIKKSGLIGIVIASFYFIIFLLDVFFSLSTKLPIAFDFIFIPLLPLIYLGVYGCGWISFNPEDSSAFGSLCDNPFFQILFFLIIYLLLGYFIGMGIGWMIKFVIEKTKK